MKPEAIVKLIFGIRGSGKTVKLRRLLLPVRRSLTVNTLNREGFTNGVVFHDVAELKAFWHGVYRKSFRLIYTPLHGDSDRRSAEIAELCRLSLACGNLTLAIEELDILFKSRRPPDEINEAILAGREPGLDFIGISQTPKGFRPEMRSQAKEAFVFHTHEPDHIAWFRAWLGKEASEAIAGLNQYHYLHWRFDEDGRTVWTVEKDEYL